MPIRPLPPLLVNQIAAGEVIERPASVVKELVENAIDAGATRIDVAIEQGGKERLQVSDDGDGIPEDEIALALAPHATSKIETAGDLDMIATMGFRGEALASIASVSRISMRSRTRDRDGATVIDGEGEQRSAPRPAGGPPGTAVTVRNLFFNTPARRKFLKTDQTESGRVSEVVQNLALAHPAIGFTLDVDGRRRLDLAPAGDPLRRVLDVLGDDLAAELLAVDARGGEITVTGLAGTPAIARGTARHQRTFLNGRLIADRTVNHAIREAYRGLIEPSRTPTAVLFLEMDPRAVDVNVHPTKAEVRFRNQSGVHRAVHAAVLATLRAADLTPAVDLTGAAGGSSSAGLAGALAVPATPEREFSSGLPGRGGTGVGSGAMPSAGVLLDTIRRLDTRDKGFVYREVKEALAREAPEILEREIADGAGGSARTGEPAPTIDVRPVLDALQVHDSYIVTADGDGLLIIDQHALHERVMFEQLKQRVEAGTLEGQRLLMPAVVEADARHLEALETIRPLLARLGIEVEPMGPTTLGVHAFTSLLFERKVEPEDFLRAVLERAAGDGLGQGPEAALHEVLDMMACKAAIKAGDRLEPAEIERLLRHRETVERSSNCPHGRPTTLRLSLRDLERQFGRR